MKMTKEHYGALKGRVTLLVPQIPTLLETLAADPKVKSLEERLMWDVFHAAKIYSQYTYQEFDYTDSHIRTAMGKIFRELNIQIHAFSGAKA